MWGAVYAGTFRGRIAAGLHKVGENAASLTQSSNVLDPRQARMRMGACRRRIDSKLSVGRRGRVGGGCFGQEGSHLRLVIRLDDERSKRWDRDL